MNNAGSNEIICVSENTSSTASISLLSQPVRFVCIAFAKFI